VSFGKKGLHITNEEKESLLDKGLKRQARNFGDIYILVILVSKQFATFLWV
jgi:hypothetical protein